MPDGVNPDLMMLHLALMAAVQGHHHSAQDLDQIRYSIATAILSGFLIDEVPEGVSDWAMDLCRLIEGPGRVPPAGDDLVHR